MLTRKFILSILALSFIITSCYKDDNVSPSDDDGPPQNMDELDVPENFDWKTTKTIQVSVNIPASGDVQPLIITNRARTKRYFKGYPAENSRTVSAKITIPSYLRELRLVYNGAKGPNMAFINNGSLVYNFNDNLKSAMDNECDLSGFETFTMGGWGGPNAGDNPGTVRDAYFDDVYDDDLIVGDDDGYTLTFETSGDIQSFLPEGGQPDILSQSYINPTGGVGVFAGQVTAAILNRDYSEAGHLGDNDDYHLGELIFVDGPFEDMTIDEFLDIAQTALSGEGLGDYTASQYSGAATNINENFIDGNNNGAFTCPFDDDEEDQDPFVEVDVTCVDGDVIFTISNTGDGDMEDDFDYTISKNGGTIDSDDYELDASQTVDFSFTGYDTDVFEIEVETPRGETLTESITGCGEEEDDGGGDDDDETITEDFQGTLAYEDLWPGKGDYDFNDLVIDYDFDITKNNQEIVQDITVTFVIKAFGASQHNGFGFTIPSLVPGDIASVDGYDIDGSSVFDIAGNGTEQNQSKATFIVFDDVRRVMPQTTPGVGVNTELQHDFIEPVTIQLDIELSNNSITYSDLDIGSFNPFIVVNSVINGSLGERGREVHLPGYEPSDLFDASYFGQQEDASDPGEGTYFVTENNLPWAINIAEGFDWVIEYQDITGAYLYFADWAQSNGTLYPDWYVDNNGYRNDNLIYPTQKGID